MCDHFLFRWFQDGHVIAGETSDKLDLRNIQRDLHTKDIVCEATNAGGSSSRSFTMNIECKFILCWCYVFCLLGITFVNNRVSSGLNPRMRILWFPRDCWAYEALGNLMHCLIIWDNGVFLWQWRCQLLGCCHGDCHVNYSGNHYSGNSCCKVLWFFSFFILIHVEWHAFA